MPRRETGLTVGRRRTVLVAAAALMQAAGQADGALPPGGAQGLYYERALMSRADARCRLFAPAVAAALAAARDQARSAALRAGGDRVEVDATRDRALAKADTVDCRAPGLATAAARLRQAFSGYAQLSAMRFPGARSAWLAERPDARLHGPRWSLVEALPGSGGWVLFGEVNGGPVLLDARRNAAPAATARLVVRDPTRWAAPVLANAPPQGAASRTFLAVAREKAPPALRPAGATDGELYPFPPAALDALTRLDPRESGRIELVYPAAGRERVFALQLEIGDIAAARAFLAAGARPAGPAPASARLNRP